jgi:hypothetical protein
MAPPEKNNELPLVTRVAVLEAKVRLLSIVLKWLVAGVVGSLLAYVVEVALPK